MARYCTRENEPLGRWNNLPIYLTTILTALFVAGLFVSAVLSAAQSPILRHLIVTMPPHGWTSFTALVTYPFIGPVNFFTPLGILCFYSWSVGVETHLGRRALGGLLGVLVLVPVAVMAVWWWGFGASGGMGGNFLLTAGLLVAFATLYPNAEWFGWIPFKWFAFACITCGSLMEISNRDWVTLSGLWATCAGAFLHIRWARDREYDDSQPVFAGVRSFFRRKPKLRVLPDPVRRLRQVPEVEKTEDMDEVDTLLDKIAKHGVSSLTPREKEKLERARQELLKKDR